MKSSLLDFMEHLSVIYELKICFDYYKERIALKYWAMGKKLGNFILELNNIKKSFGNTEVLKGN